MIAHYEQTSGLFVLATPLPFRAAGYAGRGHGRNNHLLQSVRTVGPIPVGRYTIGRAFTHERLGPVAMRLDPHHDNQMFGRSGFLIHGDNTRGDASHGCIILSRAAREVISRAVLRERVTLHVHAVLPRSVQV